MPPGKSLSSKVRLPSSAWAHLAHTTSIEACFGRSDPVPGRSNVWKHWRFGTFERAGQVRVCCARGQAHPGSATKMGHQRPVPPLFLSGLMACRWPSCRKHVPINWLTTPLLHRHYIVTTPSLHRYYTVNTPTIHRTLCLSPLKCSASGSKSRLYCNVNGSMYWLDFGQECPLSWRKRLWCVLAPAHLSARFV